MIDKQIWQIKFRLIRSMEITMCVLKKQVTHGIFDRSVYSIECFIRNIQQTNKNI